MFSHSSVFDGNEERLTQHILTFCFHSFSRDFRLRGKISGECDETAARSERKGIFT